MLGMRKGNSYYWILQKFIMYIKLALAKEVRAEGLIAEILPTFMEIKFTIFSQKINP